MNLSNRVAKALSVSDRLEANIEWLDKLQFAVHDKIALIGQLSAAHAIAEERCKQLARTKDLVTALCECVSALDKITSDPGFPIENNEAAIALRSNLLAHEALTALTAALEKVEGKIERSGK